jgi:uncharacterized membrane protein
MTSDPWFLIIACTIATYVTRFAGHTILSRFGSVHFRVEAALEAVPVAVMTALVAPSLVSRGPAEAAALVVAALVALKLQMTATVAAGLLAVVAFRAILY